PVRPSMIISSWGGSGRPRRSNSSTGSSCDCVGFLESDGCVDIATQVYGSAAQLAAESPVVPLTQLTWLGCGPAGRNPLSNPQSRCYRVAWAPRRGRGPKQDRRPEHWAAAQWTSGNGLLI